MLCLNGIEAADRRVEHQETRMKMEKTEDKKKTKNRKTFAVVLFCSLREGRRPSTSERGTR